MRLERDIAMSLLEDIVSNIKPPNDLEMERSWDNSDLASSTPIGGLGIGFRRPKGWIRVVVIVRFAKSDIVVARSSASDGMPIHEDSYIIPLADPNVIEQASAAAKRLIKRHLS